VGFYTDILGLPVVAFDPNYAMFTSPSQDFFLAVVPAGENGKSTPTDALRIQFMVADIFETVRELERRGIVLEQNPLPCEQGSSMYITYFRTPHGLCVDLWGIVPQEERTHSRREADTDDFGFREERVRPEREEIKNSTFEQDFTERERVEPEGYFEDEEADEEEDSENDSTTGFRFFVEPPSEFTESGEGETGTAEELNFGVPASEEPVMAPRQSAEFEEEQFEEEEEDLDQEEDDSSHYEYIYVDDV
jgi:catechol 2,3-dioxygenase-like lactoylglutathione lyase family enzyme